MPLLLDWLISSFPTAKRQTLREMLASGRVTINGEPARSLKQPVSAEDEVKVLSRPQKAQASIDPLKIIHEDEDMLVIFKPAGLLTSTVSDEPRPTAIGIIRAYLADREPQARAGVIHRLDRDASGLLVFSKNNEAYESLKRQFFKHSVDRIYTAVVYGKPQRPKDRIESRLIELPEGKMVVTRNQSKGQSATTDFELIKTVGAVSVLRVTLQTGRKHQIRAQLHHRGMPIVGDTVYAKDKRTTSPLLLCATTLAFAHPRTGKRLTFEIPPPDEIRALLERM